MASTRDRMMAWLVHPMSLTAVAVLVVNDHVLKAAFGTWWTGKLSDVAGLVFAPALFGLLVAVAAPRARADALAKVSVGVVAVGFALVKVTEAGAATASAAWSAIAGPSVVLRDPTDLLALPSLVLAWLAWRRLGRAARHPLVAQAVRTARPGRGRRVFCWVVVLPSVLLGTAATSRGEHAPSVTTIVTVDDDVAVRVDTEPWGDRYWARSGDGRYWVSVPEDDEDEVRSQQRTTGVGTRQCVPSQPQVCYRPVARRLAVERTVDGGASWQIDWEVDDPVRAALGSLYEDLPDVEAELTTVGVAVIEVEGGHRVIAANLRDGLAVRDPDGTWTRTGQPQCCGGGLQQVIPLPDGSVPIVVVYPLPWGLVLGVAGAVAAYLALLIIGRRRLRRYLADTGRRQELPMAEPDPTAPRKAVSLADTEAPTFRTVLRARPVETILSLVLAIPLTGYGLLAVAGSLVFNYQDSGAPGQVQAFNGFMVFAVVLLPGAAAVLAGTAISGLVFRGELAAALVRAMAVGAVAGLAVTVTPGVLSLRLGVSLLVAVATIVAISRIDSRTNTIGYLRVRPRALTR